jgi:hypothetical protein
MPTFKNSPENVRAQIEQDLSCRKMSKSRMKRSEMAMMDQILDSRRRI